MLTAVHVYNEAGSVLELPLDASSGYVVKEIDGLGPVKADIVTTEYVGMDGGVYQNSKGNMRNIVLQLGFDPLYESDDPFGELRRALYPYLSPKMPVEMHFITNTTMGTVRITGYVESFEPSIFSVEPEIQISILCPDPYFYALVPISVSGIGSGNLSFTNPGTVESGLVFVIDDYDGSSSAGFTVDRISPSVETMKYSLYPIAGAIALRIITIKGSKSAEWKDAEDYNPEDEWIYGNSILGFIDGWVQVVPGPNIFNVFIYGSTGMTASVNISFYPKYVGL